MNEFLNFTYKAFSLFWFAFKSDPMKSITALAVTISAFSSTGGLIIGWKNLQKDKTRISVVVKRAQDGPLILQHPQEEFLLFEVYNQGISPIVINEIGIKIPRKILKKSKFINLVDLAGSHYHIEDNGSAIGTMEYVSLPGIIPARSKGTFLINYSSMRKASLDYLRQNVPLSNPNFVGSQRLITISQEFNDFETHQGKCLQITPYIVTGSAERFVGKKAIIKLGNLCDAAIW